MAASCSLLLVNYKTAMLAAEAIRTARLASRSPLQIVVVDNSVDSHQADVLRRYADVVIAPEKNLGYAAAINRARRSCDGEVLLVSNARPSIIFWMPTLPSPVRPCIGMMLFSSICRPANCTPQGKRSTGSLPAVGMNGD